MNLIEEMQKVSGRSPVEKVDPNTQKTADEISGNENLLPQAVIPIALLGLYHFSRNGDNAWQLVVKNSSEYHNWKNKLYGNHSDEVAQHVADYTHTTKEFAGNALDHATNLAVNIINESLGGKATGKSIAHILEDNRSNILTHLPATLQIGSIVGDTTIDDNTNKMDGPMSNLMHLFEKIFSSSE